MTVFSHSTKFAAQNSARNVASWVTGFAKTENFTDTMMPKVADYLTSLTKLIVITTFDLPGWITLGFDLIRMPIAEMFQREWKNAVGPVQAMKETLPEGSYRSASAALRRR